MAVFKRKDGRSQYYLYDFYFSGRRYQGSTASSTRPLQNVSRLI